MVSVLLEAMTYLIPYPWMSNLKIKSVTINDKIEIYLVLLSRLTEISLA